MKNSQLFKIFLPACLALVLGVFCVIIYRYFIDGPNDAITFVTSIATLCAFLGIPWMCYTEYRGEKKSPVSLNRISQAMHFVNDTVSGTKSMFIENNNAELYEHFLNGGIIHELRASGNRESADPIWELTRRGERRFNGED